MIYDHTPPKKYCVVMRIRYIQVNSNNLPSLLMFLFHIGHFAKNFHQKGRRTVD